MEDFNSKYTGQQVEDLLDQVASGNAGGGGGEVQKTTEAEIAAMGFTKNLGTITEVKMNGVSKGTTGVVDLGNVPTPESVDNLQGLVEDLGSEVGKLAQEKQDTLVSGENIKTINGESILGEGNIEISGGSGEVGPQGPQGDKGDKGDKGDTGVGVQSVKQTTTSNADGGSNIVTVTLTDGTKSTFIVKNGSKGSQGSQGIQGEQGPKGDKGDKGDTGANGTNGTNGVSVSSVKQTTTSSADGGSNVMTVTLSNGTTSTFTVRNGSKGSNGSNGTNGKDGADGATFTPSVDSAGNLSWSNNKGLTNPPTVNIKGPKGDAGEGGGGKELILNQGARFDDTNPIQPNKIYINSTPFFSLYIGAFQEVSDYDEYCIIFKYPEVFYLLESVKFANGQIPTIEYYTECELSVVGIGSGANRTYHAVLTPFKAL